jgi:hypothetical protein
MNHPDLELRRETIEMTKQQAAWVKKKLGCNEVVVWSACKFLRSKKGVLFEYDLRHCPIPFLPITNTIFFAYFEFFVPGR